MSNITDDRSKQQNEILNLLFSELDIPESKYQDAEARYNALGEWLSRKESRVASFSPQIYVQGSFRLGTVIKPMSEEGEYDIDCVCVLNLNKSELTQKNLKDLVGFEIKAYAKAQCMKKQVDEGKRCWTLNYADESRFHMDVLPALPDSEAFQLLLEQQSKISDWTEDSIAITDNKHPSYTVKSTEWPINNPKGYAKWFKERMRVISKRQFTESTMLMAKYASVEDVPVFKFKTPLQRAIQILKRHRDLRYAVSPDKPISIIITTLAAHAYNNEADMILALTNIVDNMLHFIEERNGVLWVPNPVNPLENFADKWPTNPQQKTIFFEWYHDVKANLNKLLGASDGIQNVNESMTKLAGVSTAQVIMKRYGSMLADARRNGLLRATAGTATLGLGLIGTTVKGHTFYGK